jgi:hypothetical protein
MSARFDQVGVVPHQLCEWQIAQREPIRSPRNILPSGSGFAVFFHSWLEPVASGLTVRRQ